MRNYDEIGYGSFNTYRSGDENSRRNAYGSSPTNERGGSSVYGHSSRDYSSADHNSSSDPGYYGSGCGSSSQNQSSRYGQGSSNMQSQNNYSNQSSGSNWTSQNRNQSSHQGNSNQYGSSSGYGSSQGSSSGYGSSQGRSSSQGNQDSNWSNRMGNWADRAGNQMENWGNRASNAWDRWSDNDNDRRSSNQMGSSNNQMNRSHRGGWTNQHDQHDHARYSHGNATQNRYSDNYDSPEGYGNSYGNSYSSSSYPTSGGGSGSTYGGRYETREGYSHQDRHHDEGGFFDNLGNKISNVWDRFIGNDEDEERRYQQRSHYGNSGRTSSNDGPPYNYGSSSRRDYEW